MARSPPLTATYISTPFDGQPDRPRQRRDSAVGDQQQIDTAGKQSAIDGEVFGKIPVHWRNAKPFRAANAGTFQGQRQAFFQATHLKDDGGGAIRILRRAEIESIERRYPLGIGDQGELGLIWRR